MITTELKEYVRSQSKLGISASSVRKSLQDAGWINSDIDEAMKEYNVSPASVPISVQDLSKANNVSSALNNIASPVQTQKSAYEAKPAGASPKMIQPNKFDDQRPFIASDIIVSRGDSSSKQPDKSDYQRTAVVGKKINFSDYKKIILPAILALAVIALIVIGALTINLYKNNADLKNSLASYSQNIDSLNQQLNSLSNENQNLQNQSKSFNQTIDDLNGFLLLLAAPASSSPVEIPITLNGILGKAANIYNLTTDKGITVYVKNSKDPKVSSILKNLVGQQVEISGNHLPGSNYLTINQINGQGLESPVGQSTATSSAASAPTNLQVTTSTK